METKTYKREEEDPVAAGPHKLAEEWSVHLLIDGQQEINGGKMDFRHMNDRGVLRNGTHVTGAVNKSIDADATPITLSDGTESFNVVVRARDQSAVYKGVLLLDNNGDMTIVGVFKFNPGLDLPGPAQDEGTWVITKP